MTAVDTTMIRYTPVRTKKGGLQSLSSLTGLRWYAAFAVFVSHGMGQVARDFHHQSHLLETLLGPLGEHGVAFFFVLSGFIIAWASRDGDTSRAFYRRRVLKIFPSHLITAAVMIPVLAVPVSALISYLPNFLLIKDWSPTWSTLLQLNFPSWSLCSEMLFYATFPLAYPLIKKIEGKYVWWTIAILMAALIGIQVAIYMFVPGGSGFAGMYAARGSVSQFWLSYMFPPTRLLEFFVGVMFARLVMSGMWKNISVTWPLLACVLCYALTLTSVVPETFKTSLIMVPPLAALIATVAVRNMNGITGFASGRLGIWLGDISFAFYLAQYPTMAVLSLVIRGKSVSPVGSLVFLVASLVLSIIFAAALYHRVDKPIMDRWAYGRKR
ncbi:acyltransferase family protein [Nocardia sp. NPDC052566]|uniref:acyltransferase family protein n=1 Tax=Nocardia sp. NPDC052566 TaxID=3364330 RepID=UPI0037C92A8D